MPSNNKKHWHWEARSSQSGHNQSTMLELELEDNIVVLILLAALQWQIAKNSDNSLPSFNDPTSMFCSSAEPGIETEAYLRRLVNFTQCSRGAFVTALVYIARISDDYKLLAPNIFNIHRLLITSVMISAKLLDDRQNSIHHYARVGGIVSAMELRRLELQMLKFLDFRCIVNVEEYEQVITVAFTRCTPAFQPRSRRIESITNEEFRMLAQGTSNSGDEGNNTERSKRKN